jgi:hypothetical protein
MGQEKLDVKIGLGFYVVVLLNILFCAVIGGISGCELKISQEYSQKRIADQQEVGRKLKNMAVGGAASSNTSLEDMEKFYLHFTSFIRADDARKESNVSMGILWGTLVGIIIGAGLGVGIGYGLAVSAAKRKKQGDIEQQRADDRESRRIEAEKREKLVQERLAEK